MEIEPADFPSFERQASTKVRLLTMANMSLKTVRMRVESLASNLSF